MDRMTPGVTISKKQEEVLLNNYYDWYKVELGSVGTNKDTQRCVIFQKIEESLFNYVF